MTLSKDKVTYTYSYTYSEFHLNLTKFFENFKQQAPASPLITAKPMVFTPVQPRKSSSQPASRPQKQYHRPRGVEQSTLKPEFRQLKNFFTVFSLIHFFIKQHATVLRKWFAKKCWFF